MATKQSELEAENAQLPAKHESLRREVRDLNAAAGTLWAALKTEQRPAKRQET